MRREQYDPNAGFYYLRTRYHNPANGRFITRDTYGGSLSDPVSLHSYLYGNANPLMYIDPGGETSIATLTQTGALFATITTLYMASAITNTLGNHIISSPAVPR